MTGIIIKAQNEVLELLAKNDAFGTWYLAGGTALAKYYYQHRMSYDLDFFTPEYRQKDVDAIVQCIEEARGVRMVLIEEGTDDRFAQYRQYQLPLEESTVLKIDFIEDYVSCIEDKNLVNDVPVLSLTDIYMRKIAAVAGMIPKKNEIGDEITIGGRQEPKDMYDLFMLSRAHVPLSAFALSHCSDTQREGLVQWFRRYDRMDMQVGLLDLDTAHTIDAKEIERHFEAEIKKLIKGMM